MLCDNHLITPKESKYGECESCQCVCLVEELVEVKVFNSYEILCESCANTTLEFLGESDVE